MGLLDDAIREHMELKRLRGADPSVLARQEQDALGPVVPEGENEEQTFEDGDGGRGEIAAQDGALGPGDDGDEAILPGDGTLGDGNAAGAPEGHPERRRRRRHGQEHPTSVEHT